jgi:hypothetical protein
MMNLDDKPDMWGTCPSSAMWGVPPDGDEYYEKRKQSDFNEELYWAQREAKHWMEVVETFYWQCGGKDGCGSLDGIDNLVEYYAQWFEVEEDEDEESI